MNQSPSMSQKRLMTDFMKLQTQRIEGVNARPDEKNVYHWNAIIFGPPDTPYEDGTFRLVMDFPQTYPMNPPVVRFEPAIYHPNVYNNGAVCLDILNKAWSPTLSVSTVLLSIQALLSTPNPNSPANAEAATLYQTNRSEYEKRVKQAIERSWAQQERADGGNDDNKPPSPPKTTQTST